jgi:hypothetical protein
MRQELILYPALGLVALTFGVWVLMYVRRIGAMRRHRMSPELYATRASRAPLDEQASASDNFQNLLELPVLFYVLVLALYATQRVDAVFVALAWAFVAARLAHTLVHVTYNRVLHRFAVYVAGAALLWIAWLRFGWMLAA